MPDIRDSDALIQLENQSFFTSTGSFQLILLGKESKFVLEAAIRLFWGVETPTVYGLCDRYRTPRPTVGEAQVYTTGFG